MATAIQSKMKLNKLTLIREVRAERDKALDLFRKAEEEYPKLHDKWLNDVEEILVKALNRVQDGKDPVPPGKSRYGGSLDFPTKPQKPVRKSFVCRFDQSLDFLGKVDGDFVSLKQEEYLALTGRSVCR